MTQLNLLAEAQARVNTPPGLRLSSGQRGHLRELARLLGRERVAVIGLDSAGQPTISRRDARGVATYSLHSDGRGVDPVPPVAALTDEEIERFDPDHFSLLMSFPSTIQED